MYVSKFGKGNNVYVRVMESYRDSKGKPRSRVVKNLGRYADLVKDDPEAFNKLRQQYGEARQQKKEALAQTRLDEVNRLLSCEQKNSISTEPLALLNYGHYVLKRIWEDDLALDRKIDYLQKTQTKAKYSLNAAISYLSFMKVLDPASILFRFHDKDNFIGDPAKDLSLRDLYSALNFVKENKDELMKWVNRQMDKQFGKTRAKMVLYDVTNAYFESMLTDAERGLDQSDFLEKLYERAREALERGELSNDCFDEAGELIAENLPKEFLQAIADEKIQHLKMRGPSKEHRFDLPIVSIALVVDSLGFPMDVAVFAGNKSEFKSMKESIADLKKKYDITDITVSADRGINSVENLEMLQKAGFGFLVAQKISNLDKKLTEQMLNKELYTPFDPQKPEAGGYQVIEKWKKETGKDKSIECTLVLTYNEKRRKRDEAVLNALKSIVESKVAKGEKLGSRKTGWAALAKTAEDVNQPILGINEKVFEKRLQLCGYAGLVYAPPKKEDEKQETIDGKMPTGLVPSEIAAAYAEQCRIEECFRIMKSNLGLRPMFVWTSDHIRGHVTICVLALLLLKLLQHKLKTSGHEMSFEEICSALKNACLATLRAKGADGQADAIFLSCARRASLRKGREYLSTEEIAAAATQGKIKVAGIQEIMTAVGLEPIPHYCNRHELARCLKTRFGTIDDAIPLLHRLSSMQPQI